MINYTKALILNVTSVQTYIKLYKSTLNVVIPKVTTKIYCNGFINLRLILENGIINNILDTLKEYKKIKKQVNKQNRWDKQKTNVKCYCISNFIKCKQTGYSN